MSQFIPLLLVLLFSISALANFEKLVCAKPKKEEIKSCGLKPEPAADLAEVAKKCEEDAQYEMAGQINTQNIEDLNAYRTRLVKTLETEISKYSRKYSLFNPTDEEKKVIKKVKDEISALEVELKPIDAERMAVLRKSHEEKDENLKNELQSQHSQLTHKINNLYKIINQHRHSIGINSSPLLDWSAKDDFKPQVLKSLKDSIEKFKNYKTQLEDKSKSESELKVIIFQTQGYLSIVEKNLELIASGRTLPCGLTIVEYHMIHEYTASDYVKINAALREGPQNYFYTNTKIQSDLINKGLEKIASHKGLVSRGSSLPTDILKKHCVGCIVQYDAFTSTSIGYGFPGEYRFAIQSKNGKYIAPIANSPTEEEVLFKPGTRFKILKIGKNDGGVTEYTMQEVE